MKRLIIGLMATCLALPFGAQAGGAESGDSAAGTTFLMPAVAAPFAKQIEQELATKGARVAIVFRSSQPHEKLPDGVSYTHGAFWVYSDLKTPDGRTLKGYAVYNLYHGNGETLPKNLSYLKQDFPYDFVKGSAEEDVAVLIPTPEMQRRLLGMIGTKDYEALHVPDYSLVSNPHDPRYQNCVEFMLDIIAAVTWETKDYAQIKANLAAHFEPTPIRTNLVQRALGPAVDSRIRLDDQKGGIETATSESLSAFMTTHGLLSETYVLDYRPQAAITP
ncbi:DUF2145 domain-containing protein [Asticcacaulis tiandongensis]|uniref:DUF2145 domain-containing protein n=1 Tax=Asticcacaulis tiandongensis TaxID=2565365 RepID=UPI001FE2F9D7|nr:DUF2145 domain-containing protein [Asticcacaulis tiandongensis]